MQAPASGSGSGSGSGAGSGSEGLDAEGDDMDTTFDGIQDGGFHEGYWRARYGQR